MAKEVTEILEAMTAEDLKRRREIAEKLFSEHFSSHEARKTFIREFAAELREARKNAVETGNEERTALDEGTPEDMFGGNTHIFTMNSTKFKLGCLLSVIIFIFIIYLLFHVFSAMMVVLGPVIIIGVIVALIMKITGR